MKAREIFVGGVFDVAVVLQVRYVIEEKGHFLISISKYDCHVTISRILGNCVTGRTGHRIFYLNLQNAINGAILYLKQFIIKTRHQQAEDMDGAQDQSLNGGTGSEQPVQRQVRLQLTTRHEDVALPENTGPILVPTGKNSLDIYKKTPPLWEFLLIL